jgi:hypothetical protein
VSPAARGAVIGAVFARLDDPQLGATLRAALAAQGPSRGSGQA